MPGSTGTSGSSGLVAWRAELVKGTSYGPQSVAAATKGVDAVFHLAGLIKALNYEDLLHVNEQGRVTSRGVRMSPGQTAGHGPGLFAGGCRTFRVGSPRARDRPEPSRFQLSAVASARANWPPWIRRSSAADDCPSAGRFRRRGPDHDLHVPPHQMVAVARGAGLYGSRASMIHAADLVTGLIAAAERGERMDPGPTAAPAGSIISPAESNPTFAEWGQLIARSLAVAAARAI